MPDLFSTTQAYSNYTAKLFVAKDDALEETLAEARREGLPEIMISPSQGKLLHLLAHVTKAERILEVGTLGGYSAIWLARALPDHGKLITLELDEHHAEVARRNIDRAGVGHKVEIRVGPASQTLATLSDEPLFDLAFIDANKDGYVEYLNQVLPLVREGGLILGDNTLPGCIIDGSEDTGTLAYNGAVAANVSLVSTIIPILKGSGIDGLTVSVKQTA